MDQYLEEGVSEVLVDRWVQTASILHSNGDALDIAVRDGCIVGVRGMGVARVNKGRLGPKDLLFGWQANATTLIVSLGLLRTPPEMLMAGGMLLTVAGWAINRALGVLMPVWSARG